MRTSRCACLSVVLCVFVMPIAGVCEEQTAVDLPPGVSAVWDIGKAHHETTPTRERISINGLWRWQPAKEKSNQPPSGNWGYFKVPGCWPGITDYMQKDSQTVFAHPSWQGEKLAGVSAAWYQREISVPKEWAGRHVTLTADYVNSDAVVFIDGKRAGQIIFPSGEVELTSLCAPGSKHVLSILVTALPLKDVVATFNDTNAPKTARGEVNRRGLCGDVYLVGAPAGPRITEVKVDTSVRKGEITIDAALQGLAATGKYVLRATVSDKGQSVAQFAGKPFSGGSVRSGRLALTEKWKAHKLWDVHTPQNMYDVTVSLVDASEKVLDTALPVRFGFREFWIDGRDFYLNGTRIFLSALPLDDAQVGAATACYEGAKETLLRLKGTGINFVYTHNYDCKPGSHLSFEEILRAADDVGMLVSLSQPHCRHYSGRPPTPTRKTATPTTPSSTSAWRRTIPRSCSTR